MLTNFQDRLHARETVFGPFMKIRAAALVEIAGYAVSYVNSEPVFWTPDRAYNQSHDNRLSGDGINESIGAEMI